MIYITQLIFINQGKEDLFLEFERTAIPLMEKYGGKVIYRIRPDRSNFIDCDAKETPYEIHIISFDSEQLLQNFLHDDERQNFIHLKNQSVKSILLVKGSKV